MQLALQVHRRGSDTRWLDDERRYHFEPCQHGFINLRLDKLGRDIYRFPKLVGRHVHDEFTRVGGILDTIFAAAGVWEAVGREHHIGWVVAEIVKLAVRSEIHAAGAADRGEPADGAWHHNRFVWIEWKTVIILVGLIEHVRFHSPSKRRAASITDEAGTRLAATSTGFFGCSMTTAIAIVT